MGNVGSQLDARVLPAPATGPGGSRLTREPDHVRRRTPRDPGGKLCQLLHFQGAGLIVEQPLFLQPCGGHALRDSSVSGRPELFTSAARWARTGGRRLSRHPSMPASS